jgi:hypothetical protein
VGVPGEYCVVDRVSIVTLTALRPCLCFPRCPPPPRRRSLLSYAICSLEKRAENAWEI